MAASGAMKTVFLDRKDLVPACRAVEVNANLRHDHAPQVRSGLFGAVCCKFTAIRRITDDSGSSTSNDEAGRERARLSNCLLLMRKAGDLRQPDYARTLTEMFRRRFDAVAQARIPDQLSNLVERFRASGGPASSGDQHTPEAPEEQHQAEAIQAEAMQQPSSVVCPFCLGTGKRPGANAAQPAVVCSRCRGRGLLDTIPKATDL
jgi:hypothetical protein